MLSKNAESILKIINEIAPEGYKIFNSDDFFNCEVEKGIFELAEKNHLNLKYCNQGEYLVSLTSAGKRYFKECEEKLVFRRVLLKRVAIFSFLGSFIGCLIACLLIFFMVINA